MPPKSKTDTRKYSMYPGLHDQVARLLLEHGLAFEFNKKDDGQTCTQDYDTNIMGRFACRNSKCPTPSWTSKQIAITIRRYADTRYNARVYHQSGERCGQVSRPYLDHSYAERIAYRLKRWSGVKLERPPHSGKSKGPHKSELCEGCKMGRCGASDM